MGELESWNLYAYCHNDPVNKYDVLGLAELHPGAMPTAQIMQMLEIVNGQISAAQPYAMEVNRRRLNEYMADISDIPIDLAAYEAHIARRDQLQLALDTRGAIGENGYGTFRASRIILKNYGYLGARKGSIQSLFAPATHNHYGVRRAAPYPVVTNSDGDSSFNKGVKAGIVVGGPIAIDLAMPLPPIFTARQFANAGRFTQRGKFLLSEKNGIPMDPNEYRFIKEVWESGGKGRHIIDDNPSAMLELDRIARISGAKHVEGWTMSGDMILLRKGATRSGFFEELIHSHQIRRLGMNPKTDVWKMEVHAKETLIKMQKMWKIPEAEHLATVRELERLLANPF